MADHSSQEVVLVDQGTQEEETSEQGTQEVAVQPQSLSIKYEGRHQKNCHL